jgi:hypothetical protein
VRRVYNDYACDHDHDQVDDHDSRWNDHDAGDHDNDSRDDHDDCRDDDYHAGDHHNRTNHDDSCDDNHHGCHDHDDYPSLLLTMTRPFSRKRRCRGDRGVAIVEAAIVTPVFFLFVLAIMEFGLLFKDSMSVQNAAVDGAREGSSSGVNAFADYDVLSVVQRDLAAITQNVNYVIVFKASGTGSSVPAACLTAASATQRGVAGSCNIYYPADWLASGYGSTEFGYDPVANPNPALLDVNWPALSRSDHKTAPGPDYLGVYIQATHQSLTGVVSSITLNKSSVIQLEATRK